MYTVPTVEHEDPGWRFVGLWILTYVLGSGFGLLLAYGPLLLVTIHVAQWYVLRRYIPQAGYWVAASIVGGVGVLGLSLLAILIETPGPLLSSAVAGLGFGIPQFLVLRRSIPQAGWWIALQLLALLASSLVTALVAEPFAALVVFVVVYALSTGLGLRWLLAATPQSHQRLPWLLVALGLICALAALTA